MAQQKLTLGQAIDQVVAALEPLDVGARKTALEAVCAHLDIAIGNTSAGSQPETNRKPPGESQDPARAGVIPPPARQPPKDIRTLKEEKNPSSARQMACLIAFYLQEHAPEKERKDAISTADLEKYFKQAGFKLPQRIGQVLTDAKASGYFDSAARGEYKLNAVGYNLVAHNLPNNASEA